MAQRILIAGDTVKVKDAALGGSPVPTLKAWFDFGKGQKNVIAITDQELGITSLEVNDTDVTMAPLLLALSEGFTVTGAPVFIKMTSEQYAGQVPEGISNRSYLDAENVEQIRTWSEWHDDNHEHLDAADGDKIVAGNSFGEELSSNELLVLMGAGFSDTMMLGHEVRQYLPQSEI